VVNVLLYFAMFIFCLTVFIIIYGVLAHLSNDKIRIEKRIEQIKDIHKVSHEDNLNTSFSERAIKPFYDYFSKLLLKSTPSNKINLLNKKLERAGLLKNSSTENWMYRKSMIIIIASTTFGILTFLIEPSILKSLVISAFIMLFLNVFFNFYLSKKISQRKKKILKDLPFTLDLITVSVEAGLSFDGAMIRVVSNISGEICDEFAKCLKEIRMGIERKVALKNMSERAGVRELSMFITSLIQADEMGISLGKVLRIESANLREHIKQVAREKAMKAPIKMLFPLIFFIFPSIFIIILGPAIIKIMTIFKG
jgi:tight adherence protein C